MLTFNSLDWLVSNSLVTFSLLSCFILISVYHDQTRYSATIDLGIYCLPMPLLWALVVNEYTFMGGNSVSFSFFSLHYLLLNHNMGLRYRHNYGVRPMFIGYLQLTVNSQSNVFWLFKVNCKQPI